jgi:hypothetical protein
VVYCEFNIIEKVLDHLSVIFYTGAIFYAQSQYFKQDNVTCSTLKPELHKWLLVDIMAYYFMIVSAMIYLFLASLIGLRPSEFLNPETKHHVDFVLWVRDHYDYLCLFMTQLMITCTIYNLEKPFKDGGCGTSKGRLLAYVKILTEEEARNYEYPTQYNNVMILLIVI